MFGSALFYFFKGTDYYTIGRFNFFNLVVEDMSSSLIMKIFSIAIS